MLRNRSFVCRDLGAAQLRYCSYFERAVYADPPPHSKLVLRHVLFGALEAIPRAAGSKSGLPQQYLTQPRRQVQPPGVLRQATVGGLMQDFFLSVLWRSDILQGERSEGPTSCFLIIYLHGFPQPCSLTSLQVPDFPSGRLCAEICHRELLFLVDQQITASLHWMSRLLKRDELGLEAHDSSFPLLQ